jgi:hypothetical protein
LLQTQRQRLFKQHRRGERGQELGVQKRIFQIRRSSHVAHAPAGREDLGVAADVNGFLQAIEHRQAHRMGWGHVPVGVVFDHMEVVAVRQIHQLVGNG